MSAAQLRELDLADIGIFIRVVEAGSFSAAARGMYLPKSSVSRRVARLEARLGVLLLHRTTRSLALTEAGLVFHRRASAALEEVAEAAGVAADSRELPRGTVRMAAPQDVGAEVLPELIASFVARYPEVAVEVELAPDTPSLITGGFDLALRIGAPQPGSAAVALQDTRFRLYAAPTYLARRGVPGSPADIAHHDAVLFRPDGGLASWHLTGPDGDVRIDAHGPVRTNDLSFARRTAVAGAGIALLPDLVGSAEAAEGRLVLILGDHHARGLPLHLELPRSAYTPLRVRVLRDHLVEHFPQ